MGVSLNLAGTTGGGWASEPREVSERVLGRPDIEFAMLFEHHPAAMIVIDPQDCRIRNANDVACRLYGYDRETLIGLSLLDIVTPERRVNALACLQRPTGRSSRDVQHRTQGGELIDVHIDAVDVPLGGGRVRLLTVRDITEQKRMEGRLRQVQKLDALGQVTGEVAHDFNNLLAIMTASVEDILDLLPVDHEGHESGSTALRAAETAASLTRRLLAFVRQQDLAPQRLAPAEIVPQLAPILRTVVSTLELVFDVDPATRACMADRGQLETALLNLVVNARDATSEGRIVVGVRERRISDADTLRDPTLRSGEWITITVTDTGSGMSPEIRRRVFEPFFTTKEVGKGTGLGLSQVHGLVSQSMGFITVDSAVGLGTSIALYFPIAS